MARQKHAQVAETLSLLVHGCGADLQTSSDKSLTLFPRWSRL